MKKISLESIKIHNFKGIRDLSIDFNSQDVNVYGDNDAGKTSIYDAFLWCLFNKDSKERTQIKWKPLDENNNPIHGLQTSVKVELSVNGEVKTFEKIRAEKEVIKRNSKEKTYEDVPKYLVNGLETSTKKVYDQEVEKILDQEKFKNLTSVTYFAEQLSPEERREALFGYFGTETDEEIIDNHVNLHPLKEIIGGDTVNNSRARVAQELKQLNETLKNIPVKIEGIQAALPEIENINQEVLLTERNTLTRKKNSVESELVTIRNGGNLSELLAKLRTVQEDLTAARLTYENLQSAKLNGIEQGKSKVFAELNQARAALSEEEIKVKAIENELSELENHQKGLDEEYQRLINQYDVVEGEEMMCAPYRKQPFDETALSCSHCQRPYELDKQEEMKAHHELEEQKKFDERELENKQSIENFKATKELKLEEIRILGTSNNEEREQTEEKLTELKESLLVANKSYQEAKSAVEKIDLEMEVLNKQIQSLESEAIPFETTKNYKEITGKIAKLNEYIAAGNESVFEQTQEKQLEIDAIEKEVMAIDEQLATLKEYERQQSIIEQFNDQERDLSERKGEVLAQLVLFEEFYITKRDLLQDRINSHFSIIKWKLFGFYEDGGLNESICEPMINGVDFSALNNGSRMQAGLDVSNTLMQQEGYMVPIFIDNAEGMASHKREAVKVDTQVIATYVSEKDKKLRFEFQEKAKVGEVA